MTYAEWEKLKDENPKVYVKEYKCFMLNKDNRFKCEDCPANDSSEYKRSPLPCGLYHCWMDCVPE